MDAALRKLADFAFAVVHNQRAVPEAYAEELSFAELALTMAYEANAMALVSANSVPELPNDLGNRCLS